MKNEINHTFDNCGDRRGDNFGCRVRSFSSVPSRCVDVRQVARIFNVRAFVFMQFMRQMGYKPELDPMKKGSPRYLCPAHVIEDNRIEFQKFCRNLFERRSPLSVSEERKKMVNGCLSTTRYEAAQFEEKLAAKESRTKRLIRIGREQPEAGGMPPIYEVRHYANGGVSIFEWDGSTWVFLEGETNSPLKNSFLNHICEKYAIML